MSPSWLAVPYRELAQGVHSQSTLAHGFYESSAAESLRYPFCGSHWQDTGPTQAIVNGLSVLRICSMVWEPEKLLSPLAALR